MDFFVIRVKQKNHDIFSMNSEINNDKTKSLRPELTKEFVIDTVRLKQSTFFLKQSTVNI